MRGPLLCGPTLGAQISPKLRRRQGRTPYWEGVAIVVFYDKP